MAGLKTILALLKALGTVSWRNIQSFRSVGGQNFFIAFLAAGPEGAQFFFLLLGLIVFFPLSGDAMEQIPFERRVRWPVSEWEWAVVRAASLVFNPAAWLALVLLLRRDWRSAMLIAAIGALLQAGSYFAKRFAPALPNSWLHWVPAPPGVVGAMMRLQWREMLQTLDPYFAFVLMACTELYRASGKPLDPAAPRIISLLVSLAISTETQVLLSIDGHGVERYRQWPLRGWQILLAKDLAFLSLLSLLVLPLDFVSGFAGGVAALAVGHSRSVLKAVPQTRWRFTSGALLPDGVIQTIALFAVGIGIRTVGWPLACLCALAWFVSLLFFGRQWDRQRRFT